MGANVDVEESAAVSSLNNHEETQKKNAGSTDLPPAEKPEQTFDTGLVPWLQVLGSFFLFFNSWYVTDFLLSQLTM